MADRPWPLDRNFWERMERTDDGCLVWAGATNSKGYGFLNRRAVSDKPILAHRAAFYLTHGRWPEPACLHSCDNPPCCEPSHLREGTLAENNREMFAKGRGVDPPPRDWDTCPRGHDLNDPANRKPNGRNTTCRACHELREAKYAQTRPPCSIEGCDDVIRARGWCNKHYLRWRNHGDVSVVHKPGPAPSPPQPCSIDGCSRPRKARGWCNAHYLRYRRSGDPLGSASR